MDNAAQSSSTTPTSSGPNATAAPVTPATTPSEQTSPTPPAETPPPAANPPAPMPADPPVSTPTPEVPKTEPAAPAPADPPAVTPPAETPPPPPPVADPPATPTDPPASTTETPKTDAVPTPVTPSAPENPAAASATPAPDTKPGETTPTPSLTGNQTPPPPMQPQGKHFHVSPWTILLILVLLGFSGFFLYIAMSPKAAKSVPVAQQTPTPVPTPLAQSVLSLQPAPTGTPTAQIAGTQTYDVVIDTSTNTVNAVQLELSFDPAVLTNVTVTPGTFFTNPIQLVKDIDSKNGRVSYALGIQPKDKGVQGTGVVAQIAFQFQSTATVSSTMLSFLPKTLVAAQGVNPSVLKSSTNATIAVPHRQGTTIQLRPTVPPPAAQY